METAMKIIKNIGFLFLAIRLILTDLPAYIPVIVGSFQRPKVEMVAIRIDSQDPRTF